MFRYFKGWGFEKLPAHYRESPFLTLDHVVMFSKEPIATTDGRETVEDAIPQNKVHGPNVICNEEPSKLPDRQKYSRTWNTKCKEAIKQVTSLTPIVDDTESLKEVYTLLHDCIDILSNAAQKEEGLVMEKPRNMGSKSSTSVSSTSKSSTSKSGSSSSFKEIPKAKSRNPFSGRHGERAEIMKRTLKVNVDVTAGQPVPKRAKKSLSDCVIETEIVSMDLHYKADPVTSDPNPVPTSPTPTGILEAESTTCTKPDVEPGVQAAAKPQNQSAAKPHTHCTAVPPAAPTAVSPATPTAVLPAALTAVTAAAPSCIPSSTASPIIIDDNSLDPRSWVKLANCSPDDPGYKLVLHLESKAGILNKNYWLADSEIHAGQLLLKKDFQYVDGLHDPAIKGSLVVPATSEFVKILNTGSHWVCLSTISTTPGTGMFKIFDSIYQKPNSIAIEHACRMLMYSGSKVTFINEKVQRQVGANDCGLFSLAFASDLCHGLDPVHLRYDQGSMRQHYVNCLENGAMAPFPRTTQRVPFHLACNKSAVAIDCVCRLPYDRDEYVQCSYKCKALYHPTCVNVPAWALNSGRKWRCTKCKDAAKCKAVPPSKI